MGALISSLLRPLVRLLVGLIAIPLFRLFIRRVTRWDKFDAELTKDIEQWIRGSLLLLLATANVEYWLVTNVWSTIATPAHHEESFDVNDLIDSTTHRPQISPSESIPEPENKPATTPRSRWSWVSLALRLLLAVGVVEAMPDQALFRIIHPGPTRLLFPKGRRLQAAKEQIGPVIKGLLCRHLDRSSSVLAILSVIIGGRSYVDAGWICYVVAILQFLIIGLVSSRDKAIDVLNEFDRAVNQQREELIADHRVFD